MLRRRQVMKRAVSTAVRKVLTKDTMNQKIVQAEYAVRGALVLRAIEYQKMLNNGDQSLPFDKIIECNIGNPQSLGQRPITFHRQVLALVNVPELTEHPDVEKLFPKDAIQRAKYYKERMPGGTGAYSHSKGIEVLRQEVAEFIKSRDNHPVDTEDLFLTDGASQGVQTIIQALISKPTDGLLVPIPQYPLYSAGIALQGGNLVGYYLDESTRWGMHVEELRRALQQARSNGIQVRALVVINPGNPTGQCLTVDNMKQIVELCKEERLVLMADEVYQENVYASDRKFTSFRKVVLDMAADIELVSFHSTSKGFLGECGRRGGYMDLVGFCESAKEQLYKLASVSLCSNIEGQLMVALMSNPPKEGDESYPLYKKEKDDILDSLKRRAIKLVDAYNKLEGVTCNPTDGALYTFPRITVPAKAVAQAKSQGVQPDMFYSLEMLNATGVVVVPGSGFGQVDGTFHFRSTILPAEEEIDAVIEKTAKFHADFMSKYRDC